LFISFAKETTTLRYDKKCLDKNIFFSLCLMKDCLGSERCRVYVFCTLFRESKQLSFFLLLIPFRLRQCFCSNDFSNQSIVKDFFQEIRIFFLFTALEKV
jgi:hypothetical protein